MITFRGYEIRKDRSWWNSETQGFTVYYKDTIGYKEFSNLTEAMDFIKGKTNTIFIGGE